MSSIPNIVYLNERFVRLDVKKRGGDSLPARAQRITDFIRGRVRHFAMRWQGEWYLFEIEDRRPSRVTIVSHKDAAEMWLMHREVGANA